MKFNLKIKKMSVKKQSVSKPKNNSWYYFNENSDTVIIFVHGFLSNSNKCWRSKTGRYWPDIIREDSRLENPSIFLAGYHTSIGSTDYKFQDCAEEVLRALERTDTEGRPGPISASNIVFVCHSLGGIVARYILEAYTNRFASKTVGILLMASPSIGSEYADSFSGIINFYKNGVGRQLQYMNEILIDLDRRFKILIDEKRIHNLAGAEAIEHHSLFYLHLLPDFKPIVSHHSASRYFGDSQILPNTNHSTIVKPESINDPSHLFLYDFMIRKFKLIAKNETRIKYAKSHINEIITPKGKVESPGTSTGQILFDIYSADCAPYYLKRSIDGELSKTLSLCSVWVSGPSGCGKTSAIRHFIHQEEYQPLDICLAPCQGKLDADHIIEEITITARQRCGLENDISYPSLSGLVDVLTKYAAASPMVLYIDEVPISEYDSKGLNDLVAIVASLLDSVKQKSGKENIRFIISSIQNPRLHSSSVTSKFAEQMLTMDFPLWPDNELDALLNKLMVHLQLSQLVDREKDDLIQTAKGLPRFIKAYLRNKVIHTNATHRELLDMTTGQMVF